MKKTLKLLIIAFLISIAICSCGKRIVPADVSGGKIKPYDSVTFDYIFVEAIKQKLIGNGGDALKLLEQCIKINPESDAVYFQMAQIVIAFGDNNNGKKYALKALSLNKNNFWYLMMLAGTYYQENNLDSAIIFYEKAVQSFPEKEDLQLTLGNLYSENKKYDKANLIFENLDKKYGINSSSTVAAIKNLMYAGKFDEALKKAELLVQEYQEEILYKGLIAEIYRGKGEPDKAMEVYNQLLNKSPENAQTQLSLCDFFIEEKKYDDLILLLNTVIINSRIGREDKITLFARLIESPEIVKSKGDKLLVSIMVLEAAYGNDDIVLLLRPELLIAQGKLYEAEKRLEEIILIRPDNYYAWEKLLLVYLELKNYKNLQLKGEECATIFNRSFLVKLLYATAANENKNYDIALEELRKANILAGDNKELLLQVLSLKADVYYRMNDYENAFKTFDEAIKNNNEDLTILNNYAYYLAERNLRLKEAENMAKKVIEKEGTNNTFLDTYGWVLYKRGKLKEAAKIMETIIKSGEKDAEYYEHYGYIMKKRKKCDEAVSNFNEAYKLDSTKTYLLKDIENCQGSH
ncbi:MAG: tetratricopeptide repeat protein [Bacteroidia bacterium]|nr:tetratricopeptide repeat protein [Bacteroidia bacterium]